MTRREFVGRTAGAVAAASAYGVSTALAQDKTPKTCWNMKLAVSSVMFDKLPMEQVCQRAQRLGLDALDIWAPFGDCKHLEDIKTRLGGKGLRELMTRHKLQAAAFTIYHNELSQYWELIGDYGGGIIIRSDKAKPSSPQELTENTRAFFESLKPDMELAEKSNSRLAIENHEGGLLHSPDSFKAFVELNPNPKRVGIAFAPWHLGMFKTPMEEVIKIAGPQCLFFYAWQRAGDRAEGTAQLPGVGPVDFTPWLQALAEVNYSQYLSIFMHGHQPEDQMESNISKSKEYLLQCYKKVSQE